MGIPPVIVICLPGQAADRYRRIQDHLAAHGIAAHFLHGLHGGAHGIQALYPMHHNDPSFGELGYFQAPGKAALCVNHYFAWEFARLQGWAEFIVLEDDAALPDNFEWQFDNTRENLPDDWDLLYLEYCCPKNVNPIPPNMWVSDGVHPMCSAAILIRDRAIPVLQKSLEPMNAPLDIAVVVRAMPQLKVYVTTPRLVSQLSIEGLALAVPCGSDWYTPEQLKSFEI